MESWLDNFRRFVSRTHPVQSSVGTADGASDEVLAMLRDALEELGAVYSRAAQLGQELTESENEAESARAEAPNEEMAMLEKGLLVKVFLEIAKSDRQWCAADRDVASLLFHHIWGSHPDNLERVLIEFEEQAASFSWDRLLEAFANRPAELREKLASATIRIANLTAKADGRVQFSEIEAIRRVERAVAKGLLSHPNSPGFDSGTRGCETGTSESVPDSISRTLRIDAAHVDHFMQDEPSFEKGLDAALRDLDRLVGLETVKKEIHGLVDFLSFQRQREAHGLKRNHISLNACFVGNPGTGKTTVARLLGRVFQGLGILTKGHTVETDRAGLVAEYAGQTGPKSHRKIDEALDGVLFVDEAYSLVPERISDSYGAEAIQALLKRIEDDRERLVAVLAGYPAPMDRMVRSNPGLSSRFQLRLEFPDFSADELIQVFGGICDEQGYRLLDPTTAKLKEAFEKLIQRRDEHFGNGRTVRNIFEAALRKMARRIRGIAPVTLELLTSLQPEDIDIETAE